MTHNNKLINQLRALVLLTQTEEQVARTRISQARTDAVRKELTQQLSQFAVKLYGSGHVVAYNRVRFFHDGIDFATYGLPGVEQLVRSRIDSPSTA